MSANARMRMPLLDVAFQLMDSARSPQDFTLILHLRNPPDRGWFLCRREKRDESFSHQRVVYRRALVGVARE